MSTQPSMSGSSSASPQPSASLQNLRGITASPSKLQTKELVMDYLIKHGYPKAAANFAREAGLQLGTDINVIEQKKKIKNAIYAGRLQEAIEEINEVDATILDRNQDLHFQLLNLQLIEIIKEENAKPELDIYRCSNFAEENLSPVAPTKEAWRLQLEKTMALAVFSPDKLPPVLQAIISPDHRVEIAKFANKAILQAAGEHTVSGLIELLQTRVYAEEEAKSLNRWPDGGMDIGLDPQRSSYATTSRGGVAVSPAPDKAMQDM